jgi:NAD(P)-dependent dehydrogenase (short-subunit alcohol dehydrogenase family)
MERLKGRVAVVTGASSGIGRAVAVRFAAEGARVVAVGRDEAKLASLRDEIGRPDDVLTVSKDLTDPEEIEATIAACIDRFGRIDILLNNVGGGGEIGIRLHEMTLGGWDQLMDLNLRGYFWIMHAAIPHMLKQGGGNIINVSSIGGIRAIPLAVPYLTSKAAVMQLTRSAAMDYCTDNIRVNSICPGRINTPIVDWEKNENMATLIKAVPLDQRLGRPEEVAALAAFLASDEASYCTGGIYAVDGGVLAGDYSG